MTTLPTSPFRTRRRFGWILLALFFAAVAWPIVEFARDRLLPPPADGIAWQTDFDVALRDARASSRPLLVDFTASWCPPCKAMKRSTWPDPRIGALVRERFVPVLLDVDVPANQPIAQHYGAFYLPTVLILEPDGRMRDVATQYDADGMFDFLTRTSTPPAASQPTTAPVTENAPIPGKDEPAFALFEGGIDMLGAPRRILFAAWPDGTVLREAGHSARPGAATHDATGRTIGQNTIVDQDLRVGHVPPAQVQALIDDAIAAGFDSAREINTLRPDGPSQIMRVRRDGQTRSRTHDASTPAPADRDTTSSPSAAEVSAYVELWRRAGDAIARLRPDDERPLTPAH